jgi:hypothetical protein
MEERNHPDRPRQAQVVSRLIGMDIEEYLAADAEALRVRQEWRQDAEYMHGSKALALAPNLTLYRALMRGERVPWNVLDYAALRRYGLRRHPADGRISLNDINDVPAP